MKKLTDTCYLDDIKNLAAAELADPIGGEFKWVVIDKEAKLVFGPNTQFNCLKFIEDY